MAAGMFIVPKKSPKTGHFLEVVSRYIQTQGFVVLPGQIMGYYSPNNINTVQIKNITKTIKDMPGYNLCISNIFYETNLTKV